MKKYLLSIVVFISLFAPYIAHADDEPTILAAAVQDTGNAEVVRLVVSPVPKNLEYKIVCDKEQIRVRLNVRPINKEIQSLDVPQGVPNKRVRIVPRKGFGSVIQLFPRNRPRTVCSNTSVVLLDNEVAITTSYSDGDMVFREKALGINTQAKRVAKAKQQLEPNTITAIQPVVKKDNPSVKTKPPAPIIATSDSTFNGPLAASGWAFAALIALAAWYFKKRGQGKNAGTDSIEMLPSKPLGRNQQMILAKGHEAKFLLAVSDKNVTLKTISEESIESPPQSQPIDSDEEVADLPALTYFRENSQSNQDASSIIQA